MVSLEVEFKNLLTSVEFTRIESQFAFAPPFKQTNYYFDTPDQKLQQHHCGLRIRIYMDHAEQTLKVPTAREKRGQHELLEITDNLTMAQAGTKQIQPDGAVATALNDRQISLSDLQIFAEATTIRRIAELDVGELTLDQTTYPNGRIDYELELETKQPELAQQFYQTLLQRDQIPQRAVTNKISRAVTNH